MSGRPEEQGLGLEGLEYTISRGFLDLLYKVLLKRHTVKVTSGPSVQQSEPLGAPLSELVMKSCRILPHNAAFKEAICALKVLHHKNYFWLEGGS